MTQCTTWVVGRGGLLGRHVESALAAQGESTWHPPLPICWSSPERAVRSLSQALKLFVDEIVALNQPWRLAWCAGVGVVATPEENLVQETLVISRFLSEVTNATSGSAGSLFFASSAGGVYAESPAHPPYTEDSPVGPRSAYGREKLVQEQSFLEAASAGRLDLVVGRFSNLYGPGQNLAKPQGLIAHVGGAALRREPVVIYVPLDTVRDYLYAADAGRMVAETLIQRPVEAPSGCSCLTKIFSSEIETTVASVLAAWRQVMRRPLRICLASDPSAHLQPSVLSFRSCCGPDVRGRPTLLAVGIEALRHYYLARLMRGRIA